MTSPSHATPSRGPRPAAQIDTLAGLAETLTGRGEVRNVVRDRGIRPAPAPVAARLGLQPGDPVAFVDRLRLADGVPLSLDLTYLVRDLGEPLLEADLETQDVLTLLEEISGCRLGGASIVVEAGCADEHTAALLGVGPGAPLLLLDRLTHLVDGRPVDLELVRFRGDRMTMRGTLQRLHPPITLPMDAGRAEVSA